MRFTTMVVAITLSVLAVLTPPAAAQTTRPDVSVRASWHGRAIQAPRPAPRAVRAEWPAGWSAGAVGRGSGYVRAGGSRRVREVQRRLLGLGYRPGPVDGLFGPRTEAAARWFQYKHGLPTTGRVNDVTLEVLRARSDHRPIRTTAPNRGGSRRRRRRCRPRPRRPNRRPRRWRPMTAAAHRSCRTWSRSPPRWRPVCWSGRCCRVAGGGCRCSATCATDRPSWSPPTWTRCAPNTSGRWSGSSASQTTPAPGSSNAPAY